MEPGFQNLNTTSPLTRWVTLGLSMPPFLFLHNTLHFTRLLWGRIHETLGAWHILSIQQIPVTSDQYQYYKLIFTKDDLSVAQFRIFYWALFHVLKKKRLLFHFPNINYCNTIKYVLSNFMLLFPHSHPTFHQGSEMRQHQTILSWEHPRHSETRQRL